MFDLNLQLFAGGHSVTVEKGDNVTTATASSTTDVAKDTEVTLTIVCASGYEPRYQVISGGVTIDPATKKFTMGEADVVIVVTAVKSNAYVALETTTAMVNNVKVDLVAGVKLEKNDKGYLTGAIVTPTEITGTGIIEALLNAGLIKKID